MKKKTQIIAQTALFEGLPDEQLDTISQIAIEKFFSKGETIFSEGDAGAGFFIAVSGLIKIYKVSPDGKEQILHIFGPGEPFGEVPVFTGQPFPASAQTLLKSHLLFFPRNAFVKLISTNPSLSLNMLAVLSGRLRLFANQIESLSLKEVPGRLATYLIYLSVEQKNDRYVVLDIPKGQLASLLGTIPETLSRIFTRMSDQKLIEVSGRHINLLDREKLKALALVGKDTE